jgi:hypothetical protein
MQKGERMDTLVKVIVGLIMLVLQLLITGICLAIGFKLGNIIYEKGQKEYEIRKQKTTPATVTV